MALSSRRKIASSTEKNSSKLSKVFKKSSGSTSHLSIHRSMSTGIADGGSSSTHIFPDRSLTKSEGHSASSSEDDSEDEQMRRYHEVFSQKDLKNEIEQSLDYITPVKSIQLNSNPDAAVLLDQAYRIWMKNHRELENYEGHDCLVCRSNYAESEEQSASIFMTLQGICSPIKVYFRVFCPTTYMNRLSGQEHVCLFEESTGRYYCELMSLMTYSKEDIDVFHSLDRLFIEFKSLYFCSKTGKMHLCGEYCDCPTNSFKHSQYSYRCSLTDEELPSLGQMYSESSQWKTNDKDRASELDIRHLSEYLSDLNKQKLLLGNGETSSPMAIVPSKKRSSGSAVNYTTIKKRIDNYELHPNYFSKSPRLQRSVHQHLHDYPSEETWTGLLLNCTDMEAINACIDIVLERSYMEVRSRKQQMTCLARGIVYAMFFLDGGQKSIGHSLISPVRRELGESKNEESEEDMINFNERITAIAKFRDLICKYADVIIRLWTLLKTQTESGMTVEKVFPFLHFCFAAMLCYSEGVHYKEEKLISVEDYGGTMRMTNTIETQVSIISYDGIIRACIKDGSLLYRISCFNTKYVKTVQHNIVQMLISSFKKGEISHDTLSRFSIDRANLDEYLKTINEPVSYKPFEYFEDQGTGQNSQVPVITQHQLLLTGNSDLHKNLLEYGNSLF